MKQRKIIVRVVALLMALLMGLSVFAIGFHILAQGADTSTAAFEATVDTGSGSTSPAIYVAVIAVFAVCVCIVIPLVLKKK